MKAWLADLLLGALRLVSIRAYLWVVDPERHAKIRFGHRERWWQYHRRAVQTKNKYDDMLAEAWAIQFDFKTPPAEALARGDLDPESRKRAMAVVKANREKSPPVYPAH